MILINLLPHREAARRKRRELFRTAMAASLLAGLLLSGGLYLWAQGQIAWQNARNAALQAEISQAESQIRDIATLQAEIGALRARQQAVENLQADRNVPVHLFNDLARLLPEGVYLTGLRQDNQSVSMTGVAQSNERVSELLRQLGHASKQLGQPELVEIVGGSVTVGPRDQRKVSNFTIRFTVKRSAEVPLAGASAPATRPPVLPAAATSTPART